MLKYLPLVFLCAACASEAENPDEAGPSQTPSYATQKSAPSPDYRALLDEPARSAGGWQVREASVPAPPDAKAIGETWIDRLEAREALLGYGLAGKGPDGPVNLIDTGLTEAEFTRWTAENGWQVPDHIRWSFVPEMNLPRVSEAAKAAIRVWPASTSRTGAQHEALFDGRVEMRDGCFFVGESGKPVDRLAWFHAEIGLDVDGEGFLILRNRVSGQTLARIGEDMNWGGPATAQIDPAAKRALLDACGPGEIYVAGSPEASERFLMQYPHLREDQVPPAAPSPQQ
ncbi:hypothetical protein KCG44_02290 [Pacificimonas sp. WHA3]|uniref:Lipoprotein n=1 Tax=Pacificimonas pallii TaxID=2827236 RepID=A0ABS6SB77_9SPHN|nr:hypothetical protein [Pacificimonas pallii]MBV7255610.1 hypothetical protein [Pacificimonas pallii]